MTLCLCVGRHYNPITNSCGANLCTIPLCNAQWKKKGGGGGWKMKKKDLKLDCYLLYMYTNSLFVYPSSFVGKRLTSTKEVNIFLEQVSINICKILDWDFLFMFLLSWVVWTVQIQKEQLPVAWKNPERSAHKAVKCTLVSKQNTAAPEKKRKITLPK